MGITADLRKTLARFGKYRIVERLGEGGMCHVFRARHDDAEYDCALKLLKEHRRQDEQILDLFINEADLSLLLDHPNLIRTYDAGEIDGRYYIAMELIEGGTLLDMMLRAKKRRIPIAQDFSLFVVSEILEGLNALHSAKSRTGRDLGLVHRDITPSNIFLSFDGRAVLGDLGALHIQAYGDSNPSVVLGKIGYLAPEMVLGEDIDQRADLFAVGVVLYELITNTRLFSGRTDDELMEQIAEVRISRPRRLNPHISRELESIVMRSLSRKPKERYETAEEMMYELTTCWSKQIANPYGLAAMMAALYQEEVAAWWLQREASRP